MSCSRYDRTGRGLVATLSGPYAAYSNINKPFIVGETGEGVGGDQGSYLDGNAAAILAQQFPKIVGVDYFDAPGNHVDAGIDYSFTPAGLKAFKAFVAAE